MIVVEDRIDSTTAARASIAATIGKLLVVISGLVVLVAIAALHYESGLAGNVTIWHVSETSGTTLMAVGGLAVVVAVASFWTTTGFLPTITLGLAAYLIGQFFPSGGQTYSSYEIGFGLAAGASIAMAVGAIIAVAGCSRRPRAAVSPGHAPVVTAKPATAPGPTATHGTLPPAGWYPDPSKEAPERFWTGDQWTAQTRTSTGSG